MGCERLTYKKNKTPLKVAYSKTPFFINIGDSKKQGSPKKCLSEYKYKYNGKELQEEFGLNVYDYGARFYDPATARWYSVDAFAEKYYDQSTYTYALNNPVIYIDPHGNQVEMCCDGLKGFIVGMGDNLFGTNFRETTSVGNVAAFNSGLDVADATSLVGGTLMTIDGTKNMAAGRLNNGFRRAVTAGSGGLAVAVSGPTVAAGTVLTGAGAAEAHVGSVLASNAVNNFSKRRSESSSSSSSSSRTSKNPLRRDKNGNVKPDPEAKGTSHTQLGTKEGRKGSYKQAREFDSNNKPVKDVDFTDHGRPNQHTNPHEHRYQESKTGGTRQRGKARPLNN